MIKNKSEIITKREGDTAIIICQNNDDKTLIIKSAEDPNNLLAESALYSAEELAGKDLRDILPQTIKENIEDYLEFEDMGNDLSSVLSKIRSFGIISKAGDPMYFNMRIHRDASVDKHAYFVMIMQSTALEKDKKNLRVLELLKENQLTDKTTKLAEKGWFLEESDIVHFYVGKEKAKASIAVIAIDDFEKIVIDSGKKASEKLAAEIAGHCRRTFRNSDMPGYLGDGKFGVILVGADSRNSQVPLNRLRWEIANQSIAAENKNKSVTLSIAYKEIEKNDSSEETLYVCIKTLLKNESQSNQILAL